MNRKLLHCILSAHRLPSTVLVGCSITCCPVCVCVCVCARVVYRHLGDVEGLPGGRVGASWTGNVRQANVFLKMWWSSAVHSCRVEWLRVTAVRVILMALGHRGVFCQINMFAYVGRGCSINSTYEQGNKTNGCSMFLFHHTPSYPLPPPPPLSHAHTHRL